jgi:hypothetical protein
MSVRGEPFDSPFGLSLSKTERLAQDRLVEGRIVQDIDYMGPPFMIRQACPERSHFDKLSANGRRTQGERETQSELP